MSYSLLLPCYNEKKNLPVIFERLTRLVNLIKNIEIIIINNGSTDGSKDEINRLLQDNQSLINNTKVLDIKKNIGYGNGLKQGIIQTKYDLVCWTHADLQCDLEDTYKAYQIFELHNHNKSLLIKGRRRNRSYIDKLFTALMSMFVFIFRREIIGDINGQPKFFNKIILLNEISNAPDDFNLDLFLMLLTKKYKYQIKFFDVDFNPRKYEEAKGGGSLKGKLRLSVNTFKYIYKK